MNTAKTNFTFPYALNNRNITQFMRDVSSVKSDILFVKGGRSASAKSLLGLFSLCCYQGDTVEVVCLSRDGDAESDLQEVIEILKKI